MVLYVGTFFLPSGKMFPGNVAIGFSIWLMLTFCGEKVLSTYCVPKSSPYDASNLDTYPLNIEYPQNFQATTAALVDTSVQAVKNYIIDKHNCLRTLHPAPQAANMLEVHWNDEVATGAQQHANNCVFAHNTATNRSTSQWSMCGQNLFQGSTFYTWRYAIDAWFDEVYACADGTASSCTTGAVVGHYTQVVWAKSWQVGCAVKNCGANVLYVCNYCPLGNYNQPTEPTYQTGSPCSSCSLNCKEGKLCTNHCNYFDKYTSCPSLMSAAGACASSMYKDDCAATCRCGRNDGLTNFPDTTTAAPTTPAATTPAPTTRPPTTPAPTVATTTPAATTPAPTTRPPTSTATTPATSTTTTTPAATTAPCLVSTASPGSGRPNCYNRCDATFCADKGTGIVYNEVSPCSRNYCKCNNGAGTYLSCSAGKYFDGSVPLGSQSCHAGNATWCPPSGGLSGPAPLTLDQVAPLCTAANCAARDGQNTYYALDCCSRFWCYCANGTQSVQTCPTGNYFDHRSEWAQCRSSNLLEFCPTTFTTTTSVAPAGCTTPVPLATSSLPVTPTPTQPASTSTPPFPSTTPPATTITVPPTTPPATTPVAPSTVPPVTCTVAPVTTTSQPVTTSAAITNVRPQCYNRCDTAFCSGKPTGFYATSPCSSYTCHCDSGSASSFPCMAGLLFDEASNGCIAPSSSFCPPGGNSSAPAPQPLSAVSDMCNIQNCLDRKEADTSYPLECCTPYWCHCNMHPDGSSIIALSVCPSGQYYDHRLEWLQCRPIVNFEFCAH